MFTIVDRFSKRIWLIPTHDTCTAPLLAELFIKHIVMENGVPLEIVSDRDTRSASTKGFWMQRRGPFAPELDEADGYYALQRLLDFVNGLVGDNARVIGSK
eukprot:SAG11_NODE_19625_length_462_cov_1.633609_1_plen_100_part_10